MLSVLRVLGRLLRPTDHRDPRRGRGWRDPLTTDLQASATIFLVLRRMRVPLIVLTLIIAVSVLGLTVVPGQDEQGRPARMGVFDAFYVISYTATTIGFGELPYAFTDAQRLWVILSIYLTVVGWAYAIGALLTLLQDRAFRSALALQHFQRKVGRLREPFLLLAGYGQTGQQLARALDAIGQRVVVLDSSADAVDDLELGQLQADVPALVADVSDPDQLAAAGLGHPWCDGVLALTDDDGVNLAVTMTAALLRPDLQVVARTVSPGTGRRMEVFGHPRVVNPFDRYGDHLRLALRAPASYQLLSWLEAGPGAAMPMRGRPPSRGRWVVCGYGRFGAELTEDLRDEGLEVTVVDPDADPRDQGSVAGDASHPDVLARCRLATAVGFVAGTDDDTTNLYLVAAARETNPRLFVSARQNRPSNTPLFDALDLDSLLVPTQMVAREIYAQLSTPLLWRFLQEMPSRGDAWAAALVDRLSADGHARLPGLWKVRLEQAETPALLRWLEVADVTLGDLLRDPDDRDRLLPVVPLLLLRDDESTLQPDAETLLAPGDQLLLAGPGWARRALEATTSVDVTREYVLRGRRVPAGWAWRRLTGTPLVEPPREPKRGLVRPAP